MPLKKTRCAISAKKGVTMLLKAFSVRDLKAEAFTAPFFAPSLGEGERQFIKVVRDQQSTLSQFPEDYQLFYVGEFDCHSSQYKALNAPQHLMDAIAARPQ